MNTLEFTPKARKQIRKLDKSTKKKIAQAIGTLLIPDLLPSLQIKKLKSPMESFRLRVGDYRILFEKDKKNITVHDIGHRKEIYR